MPLYQEDLAYIQAVAFGGLANGAMPAVIERLRASRIPVRRVVDVTDRTSTRKHACAPSANGQLVRSLPAG